MSQLKMSLLKTAVMLAWLLVAMAADGSNVTVGAARTDQYVPMLRGKRVGLYSNHTGVVAGRHTLDVMLDNGLDVVTVFSPEHGFRGNADAGEHVANSRDAQTGVAIVSLYGNRNPNAAAEAIDSLDVVVVDIQDVGLRFYTYYCTMIELMNEAARQGKQVVVLDRPNPNGMSVDGPLLDMRYQSGVGRLPIPVLHGLTLGEMALMANGEGWLKEGRKVDLTVVPCLGYTHQTRYYLPVAPSPNLRSMRAIYLYASMCYFEATEVSLGRGTDMPFEVYGHPKMKDRRFSFTPRSVEGAKNPPQLGKKCYGVDLRGLDDEAIIARGLDLSYLIDAYRDLGLGDKFFTSFFEKLIGDGSIRGKIEAGMSADEIKAGWADDVARFRERRRPYLLYAE
jgi:uncharacterized protein YbbC (DUF1343 family)